MTEVHPSVWISLAVAVAAIAWFWGSSPRDKNRARQIQKIEKIAISGARICVAVIVLASVFGLIAWITWLTD